MTAPVDDHSRLPPPPLANGDRPAQPPLRPDDGRSEPASRRTRPVIRLEKVVKTYAIGEIEVHALQGISITIARGDFVAIMGPSGSGKSTLMNIIGCLDQATSGQYLLDGVDVRRHDEEDLSIIRNRKIGFVFQSFNLIPRTTTLANVELPLIYAGVPRAERRERSVAALERVGLGSRLDHQPSELSGGQQQRAAVARAIVTNPPLILADEPTGNLDSHSTAEVLDVFSELNRDGRTVVLITHEDDVAARARRVISLRDGEVIEDRLNVAGSRPTHSRASGSAGAAGTASAGATGTSGGGSR
jgi:putative ABC transport system ATP-binding protein